jgi:outer membrane lipoprotein-sorting protein
MLTVRLFICSILLLFLADDISAQGKPIPPEDARMVIRTIGDAAKRTNSIEAAFVQTKELSVIKEKIVSSGSFYFSKENRLRWEYSKPFPYLIIFNGDKIYVKDDEKENHISLQSNKVFKEINNILIGAVQGTLLSDSKNFSCGIVDLRDQFQANLAPLNPKLRETLSEIVLFFNKSDYTVEKLILREASGDYTRIEFSAKKINQNIPDAKFAIP